MRDAAAGDRARSRTVDSRNRERRGSSFARAIAASPFAAFTSLGALAALAVFPAIESAARAQAPTTPPPASTTPASAREAESLATLEEAARQAPDRPELLFRLARSYEKAGRREQAIVAYRELLARDSANLEARQALERLGVIGWSESEVLERADGMFAQGRLREAAYLYERFLKVHPESAAAREGLARSRAPSPRASPASPPVDESRKEIVVPPVAPAAPVRSETAAPRDETAAVSREAAPARSGADPGPPIRPARALTEPAVESATAEKPLVPSGSVRPAPSSSVGRSSALLYLALLAALGVGLAGFHGYRVRRRRESTMSGSLEMMALPDVLQFLGLGGKTGVLEVSSPHGSARLLLDAGRIQQAACGAASGLEALYDALGWSSGSFRFVEQQLPPRSKERIDVPVQQALLEWAAREDCRHNPGAAESVPGLLDAFDDEALNRQLPF